jgi:Zn-dependent peptidase ImmA (M78 family)/DNA-binding XRE family transcriptional regulator
MTHLVNGDRIRLLRLASQLSQSDLATRIGLTGNSAVSKIENGRAANLDDGLLRALAGALDSSVDLLFAPPADVLTTRPWLRAYADARVKVIDSVIASNRLNHELVEAAALKRINVSVPEFSGDANDPAAIELFAQETRAEAELADGSVVKNMIRAAERLGCIVLPLDGELNQRHLGMSQYVDGVPYIRVSRPWTSEHRNIPGDRQRFTVAHELGHLGLHADVPPPQSTDEAARIEKQAHRFAGAFLAPADALIDDLEAAGGRVTLNTLAKLKSKWGIAVKALVVRFQQLGVVSDEQALSLYKQISSRGWNTHEPVDVTNESPVWLSRALKRASGSTDDVVRWASSRSGLGPTYIRAWLDWSCDSHEPGGSVVELGNRRATSSHEKATRRTRKTAGLTHLNGHR